MRKTLLILICTFFIAPNAFSWGQIGHRVVGHIAEQRLSPDVQERLREVLEGRSLAEVSTWMDEIRADEAYDHTSTWHWVTVPDGMRYAETEKNPEGDALGKIKEITAKLKEGGLSEEKERNYVRYLVHLVGDIHQPLHVGDGTDRGGNDFTVIWFGEASNLHRVWDSGMIDRKQLSYTELAGFVTDSSSDSQVDDWKQVSVEEWAQESMRYRNQMYDVPQDRELGYEYMYQHFDMVKQRLLQAGVRLADTLNEVYG